MPGTPKQRIAHVALVVADYDEALAFYVGKLNFTVVEDTYQPEQDKRWVVIAPPVIQPPSCEIVYTLVYCSCAF